MNLSLIKVIIFSDYDLTMSEVYAQLALAH